MLIFHQINGKIPSSGVIDKQIINPHELFYQCSKYGPEFYLVNWGLGILETNYIFPRNEMIIMSNPN